MQEFPDDPETPLRPARRIFCNRTLNLRSIKAIGYDMDYTLVHYHAHEWEARAYYYLKDKLEADGWPTQGLEYDPDFIMRGLVLDVRLGNIVKANRFGYIKRAFHGTRPMRFEAMRQVYQRTLVDLKLNRFKFLNTLFSLSSACMFLQLVDRLEQGIMEQPLGYHDLWQQVTRSLDEAHAEGLLKEDILNDPERFIDLDEDAPGAILDQRLAGKKTLLITNSDWLYTKAIMEYAYQPFLPKGMHWKDLFDVVILSARKPDFFSQHMPAFEVVNEDGLLKPVIGDLTPGKSYVGGHAGMVEGMLGAAGDEILYVGDHLFADVTVSKNISRWRTALVLRELEAELEAQIQFVNEQRQLTQLMEEKSRIEYAINQHRLNFLRRGRDGEHPDLVKAWRDLDQQVAQLARSSSRLHNANWGLIMRTGNDKSYIARKVENYADIYTSRVSNFLHVTPFANFRSQTNRLPHDP